MPSIQSVFCTCLHASLNFVKCITPYTEGLYALYLYRFVPVVISLAQAWEKKCYICICVHFLISSCIPSGILGTFLVGTSANPSMSTCEQTYEIIYIFPVSHFRKLKLWSMQIKIIVGKRKYSNDTLAFVQLATGQMH